MDTENAPGDLLVLAVSVISRVLTVSVSLDDKPGAVAVWLESSVYEVADPGGVKFFWLNLRLVVGVTVPLPVAKKTPRSFVNAVFGVLGSVAITISAPLGSVVIRPVGIDIPTSHLPVPMPSQVVPSAFFTERVNI